MTNSFSGIHGQGVPMFIVAQLIGAFLAYFVFRQFDTAVKSD